MKTRNTILLLIFFMLPGWIYPQMLTSDPAIPISGSPVTIYYKTDLDNGELHNYTGDLYAHTGVILKGSTSWSHVIGSWGNNTNQPKLVYLGNYQYKLEIYPTIEQYYAVSSPDTIKQIALVIRSADAQSQTRPDIFIDVYQPGLNVNFTNPQDPYVVLSLNQSLSIEATSTLSDSLVLFMDGVRVIKGASATSLTHTITADNYGGKWATIVAYSLPDTVVDSLYIYVKRPVVVEDLPAGVEDGINYIDQSTVTLVLAAPGKSEAFVIGDFTGWVVEDKGIMKKTGDGTRFWATLTGLTPGTEYRFQYIVDSTIRIADPYAEKVLDPWNDEFITPDVYPDLIGYPENQTTGYVSVFQTQEPQYNWSAGGYQRPAKTDLVIYELLIRDFVEAHSYRALIDTLSYLDNLGVNAIELMPVNEFDGNISWGYNPAFYFALDKYYGTKNALKEFVDSCHNRGIAVILDVVLNHSTGSSPLAALYWDSDANNVTAENPWYNVTPTHDFNVFHDFNHESPYTQAFAKRVMSHWLNEYHVDGYRFDLSKGFTQKNTLGNVAAWSAYDASRVAIWKMYANYIWSIDPGFYVILEHFADNTEEKELANYGMMLWGNMNHSYTELAMGYSETLNWGSYLVRGWNDPHIVAYMESHDEERMMYKNLNFSRFTANYNIRDINTGLQRVLLAATMFFTIPGPKMIWQFGELGYDYSIDYDGKTNPKPILWNYFDVPERQKVYKTFSALAHLKREEVALRSADFQISNTGMMHRIKIADPSMNVVVLGNFDIADGSIPGDFHNTGRWYEYFTGDSIEVTSTSQTVSLAPGEYRLYTTKRLQKPDLTVSIDDITRGRLDNSWVTVFPNPVGDQLTIRTDAPGATDVGVEIVGLNGEVMRSSREAAEITTIETDGLAPGIYFLRVYDKMRLGILRIIKK